MMLYQNRYRQVRINGATERSCPSDGGAIKAHLMRQVKRPLFTDGSLALNDIRPLQPVHRHSACLSKYRQEQSRRLSRRTITATFLRQERSTATTAVAVWFTE